MSNIQRIKKSDLPAFRIAMWDIEASSLKATYGGLFCASVKTLGSNLTTYRIDESPGFTKQPWDDRWLAVQIRDELESNHVMVGYNSINYDLKFLNTRLLYHKQRLVTSIVKHVDLLWVVYNRLALHSNRLEVLLEHLRTKTRKDDISPELWRRAAAGNKTAMNYIVKHNIKDTLALEEVFSYLIPFIDLKFRLVR